MEDAGEDTATATVAREGEAAAEARDGIADLGGRIEQYELIRPIGRGGMGKVYLARDTRLGRLVAIKVVRSRRLTSAERFRVEARLTARCVHENIVVIHDIGEQSGYLYMVLEYLAGLTLKQWLEQRATAARAEALARGDAASAAGVPAQRAIEIITPVVRAMECAHAHGIIHRDLKPSNIMLCDSGVIKVLDFGVAKLFEVADERTETGSWPEHEMAQELTFAGRVVGSELYMSPEQWGADDVDHRADIWAVGIILNEMVTGTHPLRSLSRASLRGMADLDVPMPMLSEVRPDLGKLGSIIDRCLLKRKADRIGNARELVLALEALAPRGGRLSFDRDDQGSPYAGLAAFQEDDADRFFGRGRDIATAVWRARDQPLLAVVAPSGAGKSSFVRAGIVPALKRSGDPWEAMVMRPGRHPLAALAGVLLDPSQRTSEQWSDTLNDESDRDVLAERLREQPGYLGKRLRSRAQRRLSRTLLIIDQFEEIYTLGADADERKAFVACLEGAADDAGSPIRVIITIRSDFLDRIAETPEFMSALSRGLVLLPPVSRDGLREILTRPLEATGYRFETPAMVDDMLQVLENTHGALPLLQFTASKLWDSRDRPRQLITEAAYRSIGGVAGTLASHADAVVTGLAPRDQALARLIFERLVTPERTRAMASVAELCELAPAGETGDDIDRVLARLVEARLLVVESDTEREGALVEIVHESLIDRWPMLSRWLSEHQDDAAFLARLRGAAREWKASGRPQGLLWRDEAMLDAQRWRQRATVEPGATEREFLDAVFALARRATLRRRAIITALVLSLTVVAAAMSTLALSERRASGEARAQAQQTRIAAEQARTEAARARDAARIASARELQGDPTTTLALLREVESPERHPIWGTMAATAVRLPIAQAVLADHEGGLWTAEFSPDGKRIATVANDGTVRVWNADGSGTPAVMRHDGSAWVATFSPDGSRVLSASWDGTARVWNADGSGAPIVLRQPDRISWAEWSPDGTRVVTASWDRAAWVWRADGRGAPVVLRGHEARVYRARFSPDRHHIVTASEDGTARVWNADGSGAPIILGGHAGLIRAIAYSPDGGHIATADAQGVVRVWNADGRGAPVVLRGHTGVIWALAFSPDGRRLVTASGDSTARLWNVDGRGAPVVLVHGAVVQDATFSRDGRYLLTASSDRTARLWHADGAPTGIQLVGHGAEVRSVAFSPDGERIVSGGSDRTARVWNVRQPDAPVLLQGPTGVGPGFDLARDGVHLIMVGGDEVGRLWTLGGGAPTLLRGHTAQLRSAAFSPDGARIATTSEDGTARIWSRDGAAPPIVLRGHRGPVTSVVFSPDGRRIATASHDDTARVWNADGTGTPIVLRGHATRIESVAFSPDGTRLATHAYNDDSVRIWNLDHGGDPIVLGHASDVASVAWSPDGKRIVAALGDSTARIWNADGTGAAIVLKGHSDQVMRASFSADGRRVLTASSDGTARLWNADGTGAPVVLGPHPGRVLKAELSPDGRRVLTASGDTAWVWNADGSGLPIILAGHTAPINNIAFTPDGERAITSANDGSVRIWPHVDHVPSRDELRDQLWRATSYCLPAGERQRLLGVSAERALDDVVACRRNVAAHARR